MKEYRKFSRTFDISTEEKICRDYKSGIRLKGLSKKYKSNETVLYRILKAYGVPTTRKTISYAEDVFDVIDTELKAYVLGLITSDGYIVNNTAGTRYVVSLGSTDKEIPTHFANLIQYQGSLYRIKPSKTQGRLLTEWRIMVGSKRLVMALNALGVKNKKSMNEEFCKAVPQSLIRHYIRGMIDGDGYIGDYAGYKGKKQARLGIVGSKRMLEAIQETISQNIDVPKQNVICKQGNLYKLSYNGNNSAPEVAKWLYQGCQFALRRKRKIAESFFDRKGRGHIEGKHWTEVTPMDLNQSIIDAAYKYVNIIDRIGRGEMNLNYERTEAHDEFITLLQHAHITGIGFDWDGRGNARELAERIVTWIRE